MTALTRQILLCQQDQGDWNEATNAVSELVYKFTDGKQGFGSEESAAFLLYFLPRMRRLMDRYRPTGSSFEAYLNTTLRWQLRSFALQRGSLKIRARTAETSGAAEVAHTGSVDAYRNAFRESFRRPPAPPDQGEAPKERKVLTRIPKLPMAPRVHGNGDGLTQAEAQRVLLLALKGCDHLERDDCLRLADELGFPVDWILRAWTDLRLCCTEQRERREQVRQRRDRAWFALRCLEAQSTTYASRRIVDKQTRQREYWRRIYDNARKRLERMTVAPTHQEIADVLEVPKGTVDSSIFRARQEMNDPQFRDRLARVFNST